MKRLSLFVSLVVGISMVGLFVTSYQEAAAMSDGNATAHRARETDPPASS